MLHALRVPDIGSLTYGVKYRRRYVRTTQQHTCVPAQALELLQKGGLRRGHDHVGRRDQESRGKAQEVYAFPNTRGARQGLVPRLANGVVGLVQQD